MSNSVFPTFPGLTFNVTRSPVWSTTTRTSVSQREFRAANASFPLYKVKLIYEVLRQTTGYTEFSQLTGFFNQMFGSFDSFLWTDPDDNTTTAQTIGTGDGASTQFQLVRTFGSFVEPVFDTNSVPQIYVNAVLKTAGTDYSISATGLVTFTVAPGAALPITYTGTYYRRMRFAQDAAEFTKFMQNLWNLKTLEMVSVKP